MLEWFGKRQERCPLAFSLPGVVCSQPLMSAGITSLYLRKELLKYADKPFPGKAGREMIYLLYAEP